ncbi:MAG TPA: choice-of-anchor D domain-containing protein [Candidatus Binatus sp.]|jgi:uncharacterized repeat protein (TIGR03803 family)|nr:choice-of-anchor D domain-containing protein [Candidatus Binatus sp.]
MRISAAFTSALLLVGFLGLAGSAARGQQLTPLYNFCSQTNCTDGSGPSGSLIQGSNGNFYGTTISGGKYGQGTIFKVTTTGTLTTLYSFCAIGSDCTDGAQPGAGVIVGSDGNFYGTTIGGGIAGTYDECGGANNLGGAPAIFTCGTVFKLTPNGGLTTLYTFCSPSNVVNGNSCGDGSNPEAALIQDGEGNFYGTTTRGGTGAGTGTIFKLSPVPAGGCPPGANPGNGYCETVIYSTCDQNGCGWGPGSLIQGIDGNFYGAMGAGFGVPGDDGTLFKITPSTDVLTTLFDFCTSGTTCPAGDGAEPLGVIQGSDGNLYGTTYLYGNTGGVGGAVFQFNPNTLALNVLYVFCSLTNCADGRGPTSGVIQGSDGDFYGMTVFGDGTESECSSGYFGCGTIFKVTSTKTPTILHAFCSEGTPPKCTDGMGLGGTGLVQGADFNFYGTAGGGANAAGIFFVLAALPVAKVSPASLPFASQDEGTTSSSKPVTLSNTGQEALTVASVVASGDFSETDNCVGAVAVGSSCTVNVFFKPTQTGTRTGTLTITDNNVGINGSQQTVSLTGTGANPGASFSATTLAFGTEGIHTTSLGKKVTLTSSGTTSLNNLSVAIIGPNQADFLQTNTCPVTLNVGAKCTITVTFTPSLLAAETATLQVTDNAASSPQAIALSGTGVADATLTPTSEKFGNIPQATSSPAKTINFKNNQSTAVGISEITFTGTNQGDFSQIGGTCGTSLAAKGSCSILVTFTPSLLGAESATLSVTSNAEPPYNLLTSTLSGAGIAQAAVSPTSINYGKQKVGTTSSARNVTLKNNLSSALTINPFSFTGADQGDFHVLTTTCGASLAAKSTCTISIVFKPTATGGRAATLNVNDSANNSPQTVSLTGTGD